MIRLAALAAMALVLCGPARADAEIKIVESTNISLAREVVVVHDDKRDVTCWVFDGVRKGGMSCLPDWMMTAPAKPMRQAQRCTSMPQSEPCVDENGEMWPGNVPGWVR